MSEELTNTICAYNKNLNALINYMELDFRDCVSVCAAYLTRLIKDENVDIPPEEFKKLKSWSMRVDSGRSGLGSWNIRAKRQGERLEIPIEIVTCGDDIFAKFGLPQESVDKKTALSRMCNLKNPLPETKTPRVFRNMDELIQTVLDILWLGGIEPHIEVEKGIISLLVDRNEIHIQMSNLFLSDVTGFNEKARAVHNIVLMEKEKQDVSKEEPKKATEENSKEV